MRRRRSARPPSISASASKGAQRAASVISCRAERGAIAAAIAGRAAAAETAGRSIPMATATAARRIVEILDGIGDFRALTQKRFFDLPEAV